jgi:AcrR family transcriptional regulator
MVELSKVYQNDTSQSKILDAAEEVFAEKGFDGSRVDEIALKAGVNKALLYYYFDSKDDLLKALIQKNITETGEVLEKEFQDIDFSNNDSMGKFIDKIIEFIENKKNVFRIITIEGLKIGAANTYIFELLDPIYQIVLNKIEKMGKKIPDRIMFLVETFFIATVPMIVFLTLGDKWAEYHKTDVKEVREKFIKLFKGIHFDLGGVLIE